MIARRARSKFASENMRCLWLLLSLVTVTMMGSRSAVANTLIAAACASSAPETAGSLDVGMATSNAFLASNASGANRSHAETVSAMQKIRLKDKKRVEESFEILATARTARAPFKPLSKFQLVHLLLRRSVRELLDSPR